MRYDEMRSLYPDIDQLFAGVSDLIHEDKVDQAMAYGWARRWIGRYIAKDHQQGVAEKIRQFIAAICWDDAEKGVLPCDTQRKYISGWKSN